MSKASSLFRFSADHEATPCALLPDIAPRAHRADDSNDSREAFCRATQLESSDPSAHLDPSESESAGTADICQPSNALPYFAANPFGDHVDLADPLAILRQTLEPPSPARLFSRAHKSPLPWISRSFGSLAPSTEIADATLLGAKVHCDVSVSAPFLTETMDLEAIAASAREVATESVASSPSATRVDSAPSLAIEQPRDRRRKRRALISAPIRVRGASPSAGALDEIATTVDVSRTGILFHSSLDSYIRGMEVAVVFPYSQAPAATHLEQLGRVVRVNDLGNGICAVAIALGATASESIADGEPASASETAPDSAPVAPRTKKPMVLAVDADEALRDTFKLYLQNEGYDVIAVNNAADAREVLNIFTPALIIAEVEGEGSPGYDICAHVKSSPSLRRIPVVLTTSSAYPSDYSNAHSLGAVVCMAKPFKSERLGHVVRLLAPLPEHLENVVAPHAADPTRVPGRDGNSAARNLRVVRGNGPAKKPAGANSKTRFKFPSFR